jgi:hypothetical protein
LSSSLPQNDWIDYVTLIGAVIAATTPLIKLWEVVRQDKERLELHIDWVDFDSDYRDSAPFLYVINRSKNPIFITEIGFRTGLFWRRKRAYTAVDFDDPLELNFPYEILPSQQKRFMLQSHTAEKHVDRLKAYARFSSIFRRSLLWIDVETAGGTSKKIGAERAMKWENRPAWTKLEEED